MKIVHLADEVHSFYNLPNNGNVYFIITRYYAGAWEGEGHAIAYGEDGNFYGANLGHCSCYGPEEAAWDSLKSDFLDNDCVLCEYNADLVSAVKDEMRKLNWQLNYDPYAD